MEIAFCESPIAYKAMKFLKIKQAGKEKERSEYWFKYN